MYILWKLVIFDCHVGLLEGKPALHGTTNSQCFFWLIPRTQHFAVFFWRYLLWKTKVTSLEGLHVIDGMPHRGDVTSGFILKPSTWTPPPKKRWIAMVWLLTVLFPNSSLFIWFDLLLFRNVLQCQKEHKFEVFTVDGRNSVNHPLYMKPYGKMGDSPYQLVIAGFLTHQGYECRTWFSHSVYGVTPNPAPSMGTNSSFAESCNQNKSCDHKNIVPQTVW